MSIKLSAILKERFAQTQFLIEASSFEWLSLWQVHCVESPCCRFKHVYDWVQSTGWLIEVGRLDDRPVCIRLSWDILDGFVVCSWEATSELIDHAMISRWLDERFTARWSNGSRAARCDASNFHHLLEAMMECRSGSALASV